MATHSSPEKTHHWTALWAPNVVAATVGSTATVAVILIYGRFFRRIPTSDAVGASLLARKIWIKGVVASVGDADNFRLYHTPGMFWSGPLKIRRVPIAAKELRNQTIHIRLSGVDAPEAAHFGRPSQPYSSEALTWLKSKIEGKRVYCQLVRRDQYGRIVANVHLAPLFPLASLFTGKNVSLAMIRAGWGTAYVQAGAEYGSIGKEGFIRAEEQAKTARIGMWENGRNVETPAQFKKRIARTSAEQTSSLIEKNVRSKPRSRYRLLSGISPLLPWRGHR